MKLWINYILYLQNEEKKFLSKSVFFANFGISYTPEGTYAL
jgi:hypothetical protein